MTNPAKDKWKHILGLKKEGQEESDNINDKQVESLPDEKPAKEKVQVLTKANIVRVATSINYNAVYKGLKLAPKIIVPKTVYFFIEGMEEAGKLYQKSESYNKDQEYIDYIASLFGADLFTSILNDIKPVLKFIPYGGKIVGILEFLIKMKKK